MDDINERYKSLYKLILLEFDKANQKLKEDVTKAKDIFVEKLVDDSNGNSRFTEMEFIYNNFKRLNEILNSNYAIDDIYSFDQTNQSNHSEKSLNDISNLTSDDEDIFANWPETAFTYTNCDLFNFTVGYEGCGLVSYRRNTHKQEFFIVDKLIYSMYQPPYTPTNNFYSNIPDIGVIFGIILEQNDLLRAVRQNKDLHSHSKNVVIYLIDTGEILKIPIDKYNYYRLEVKDQLKPGIAVLCRLNKDSEHYNESLKCLYSDEKICYKIVKKEKYIYEVNLKFISTEIKNNQITTDLNEEERQILFEEPLGTENALKAVLGYVPKDDQRLCQHYNPFIKGCFKGPRCKFLHEEKLEDGWTRDKQPSKMKSISEIIYPNINDSICITPTHVESLNIIYSQIYNENKNSTNTLANLNVRINSTEKILQFKKFTRTPYEQELVIALYSKDGYWYRARVIDVDDKFVKVFYVDYGNCSYIALDQLRLWDDEFDNLPFQAIECSLANIKFVRESNIEDTRILAKLVTDKCLKAIVININVDKLELKMYDLMGNDIGDHLISLGLAKPDNIWGSARLNSNNIPG